MEDLTKLHDAILVGNFKEARAITERALAGKTDPQVLVQQYMIPAMDEVGRRYESNEYFVPELLIAARAMKASLELSRPLLIARGDKFTGRGVMGTVKGDLHDGKNLVAAMLEGAGFEVIDLGVNVSPQEFVEAVRAHQPDLIGLSSLLTTTMIRMKKYPEQPGAYQSLVDLLNRNVTVDDYQRGVINFNAGVYDGAITAFERDEK